MIRQPPLRTKEESEAALKPMEAHAMGGSTNQTRYCEPNLDWVKPAPWGTNSPTCPSHFITKQREDGSQIVGKDRPLELQGLPEARRVRAGRRSHLNDRTLRRSSTQRVDPPAFGTPGEQLVNATQFGEHRLCYTSNHIPPTPGSSHSTYSKGSKGSKGFEKSKTDLGVTEHELQVTRILMKEGADIADWDDMTPRTRAWHKL